MRSTAIGVKNTSVSAIIVDGHRVTFTVFPVAGDSCAVSGGDGADVVAFFAGFFCSTGFFLSNPAFLSSSSFGFFS
ncbi:MAG: hypothetical protein LBC29_02065 [Propionibacteriaceae bacterium]|nr:hypothetical protein [Propionibacteriaceae bacterium]